MERLQEQGWYLSEQGYDLVSESGAVNDTQKLIQRALDMDLREIGSGTRDINLGHLVLQIQKLRNVAAPKSNEESRGAPRMLKLYLTDGKNNYQAVELDQLPSISLNTPPGTKILLKSGGAPISHGIILLKPDDISSVLGGKVSALIEKWELNRKLAVHSRVRSADEGGPPPWIPFGRKIVKVVEHDRTLKPDKDAPAKDNTEFDAQRQAAVAEAAKQGSKKVFGGGTKQLLDHSVQKIVDQGFTIEQAEYALRVNRNNIDRALKSLQRDDNKGNGNKESREPREPRGKRFEKKNEETKPSSGKVSLFDFLEDKLPAQSENIEVSNSHSNDNYNSRLDNHVERYESRGHDGHSSRGGRGQRSGRGSYQAPPRHSDDSRFPKRNNENYNTNNTHQTRPPRFQRSQDQFHHTENNPKPPFGKTNYQSGRKTTTDSSTFPKGFRNQNPEPEPFTRQSYEPQFPSSQSSQSSHGRYNRGPQESGTKNYNSNTSDSKIHKNQNRHDSNAKGNDTNRKENSPWVWKKGDQCLAKYWEDNQYYNAEVTAVSATTCVVQFKDFHNYEEVLQIDCLPITKDLAPSFGKHQRHDQRPNRPQRHENYSGGMEFRRGGGGSAGTAGGKGYRKRGSQRSAQPIYQPPAQRSTCDNPKI